MIPAGTIFRAVCSRCAGHVEYDETRMLTELRAAGYFRRETPRETDAILSVLRSHASGGSVMPCDSCGSHAVAWEAVQRGALGEGDAADWGEARVCERCQQPIDPERLEVFPETTLCTSCMKKADRGEAEAHDDYCPRCGDRLTLKRETGGLSRFREYCGSCRKWV